MEGFCCCLLELKIGMKIRIVMVNIYWKTRPRHIQLADEASFLSIHGTVSVNPVKMSCPRIWLEVDLMGKDKELIPKLARLQVVSLILIGMQFWVSLLHIAQRPKRRRLKNQKCSGKHLIMTVTWETFNNGCHMGTQNYQPM